MTGACEQLCHTQKFIEANSGASRLINNMTFTESPPRPRTTPPVNATESVTLTHGHNSGDKHGETCGNKHFWNLAIGVKCSRFSFPFYAVFAPYLVHSYSLSMPHGTPFSLFRFAESKPYKATPKPQINGIFLHTLMHPLAPTFRLFALPIFPSLFQLIKKSMWQ